MSDRGDRPNSSPIGSRGLTKEELLLARQVFGNEIQYSRVRIVERAFWGVETEKTNRVMAPEGNIYFPKRGKRYRENFGLESLKDKALFIHEMTHIWQSHNNLPTYVSIVGMFQRTYKYNLTEDTDFYSLGIEQQASVIEHFYIITQGIRLNNDIPPTTYRKVIPKSLFPGRFFATAPQKRLAPKPASPTESVN